MPNHQKPNETALVISVYQPGELHITLLLHSGVSIELSAAEALTLHGCLSTVRPVLEAAA